MTDLNQSTKDQAPSTRKAPRTKLKLFVGGGLALLAGAIIAGCAAVGSNPTAPTKFESLFLNTTTNVVTITKTNEVSVPVYQTNVLTLTVTNQQNQVVTTLSNVVNTVWQTNQVVTQVSQTNYTESVKPSIASDVSAGGSVLNAIFPGVGSVATQALLALLGGWAFLRSSKLGNTSTALAQEIESVREFVKALPNGKAYDDALTTFMQQHQNEAGVAAEVASILEAKVQNPDAKAAAQGVIDTINALKSTTTPLPAVNAAS